MAKYYLARLGGADSRMLADEDIASQTGERTRFAAMGGILLSTAGVATVSMFFALHHAVNVDTGWSVFLALIWGAVILNVDRFLVITLTGSRGHPVRLAVTVLVRVVLAALISIVVATPLVLQIFHSDISAELPIVQAQQSAAFAASQKGNADSQLLAKYTAQIKVEQSVVDSPGTSAVAADQKIVNGLTKQVIVAKNAVSVAKTKLECEQGGLKGVECPPGTSGNFGFGPLAQADQTAYDNDVSNYNTLNGQLTTAGNNLAAAQRIATDDRSNARKQLAKLVGQQSSLQNEINAAIAADDKQNSQDDGLLEQIHALFAASASDSGLAWAHWIVTAMFFVIEILPVTIKCLLLLGDETPYEQIVAKRAKALVEQEDVTLKAEKDVKDTRAQSMRDLATLEAKASHDIRDAVLKSDLAIALGKEQARLGVEDDLTRREKGTRMEANKRFSSATRDHILAAIDEWAFQIRETIRQGTQQSGPNGKVHSQTGQNTSGSNGQNNSGSNGPSGGI